MTERLRLKAIDQEDLQVLAACLQDALVPLREMAYLVNDGRFMAAFNRFQWETLGTSTSDDRISLCQSALRIDHVRDVKYRGLDRDLDGVKFELLTIMATPASEGGFDISLVFAGDVAIKLTVAEIALTLEDFGEAWEASVLPRHTLSDPVDDTSPSKKDP